MNKENNGPSRDSLTAAGITALAALLIFIFLYWGRIGVPRMVMAEASTPEIATLPVDDEEEEEQFIEPRLVDPGEPESEKHAEPAPAQQGAPEVVAEPDPKVTSPVLKGDNPKPAPQKEKLVTQTKPQPVKSEAPPATDKELQKVQSKTASAFSPDNGTPNGRDAATGTQGTSTGIAGNSDGWKFEGCPAPKVSLRNKTVITVRVTVNSSGRVTSATASGGNASLRATCEAAARQARWKPLDPNNTRTAKGTITFTITPK